jgi:hypothetical protein
VLDPDTTDAAGVRAREGRGQGPRAGARSGGIAPREGLAHVAAGEPIGRNGPLVHIDGDLVIQNEADEERWARSLVFKVENAIPGV